MQCIPSSVGVGPKEHQLSRVIARADKGGIQILGLCLHGFS